MKSERRWIRNGLLFAVLLTVLAFVSVGGVSAATHYVNPGDSIQDAVDLANPGDTIIVNSGTYEENVNVDWQLILRGNDTGSGKPVVYPDGGSAITLNEDGITVDGFTVSNGVEGIYVDSNYNLIINNTVSYNDYGIYLWSSCCNTLTCNTVSDNQDGIDLEYSSNYNNLTGNTVSNSSFSGIVLSESSYNNFTGNTVSYNDYGIDLDSWSFYNTIYNNYFNNTYDNAYDGGTNTWNIAKTPGINIIGGPYLGGNYWSDYTGTDTDGDGLGNTPYSILGDSNQDNLPLVSEISCTCGDICVNEMGWWRHNDTFNENLSTPIQAAVDNASAGETICVQNGTYTENVLVNQDNLTIKSKYGAAVTTVQAASPSHLFHVTADYVKISGFTVTGATDWLTLTAGIYLDTVSNCTISNNTAFNNTIGITLVSSNNNTLTNNIANSNPFGGIYLDSSSGNHLAGNTATNNDNGIWLWNYSSYNNLTNNNASNNGNGIELDSSCNNTLTNNTASYNSDKGIFMEEDSNNNTLIENVANSNGCEGIFLWGSKFNHLIRNRITGHKNGFSFAVLIRTDEAWSGMGDLSFSNYELLQLPLQHDAGALSIRLAQYGHDAAYVDYVALKKGDTIYTPATAVNLETGADVRYKILDSDYDVCDAWNSTLELHWENVPADTTVLMRAMEEDLGADHGSPLYYPLLREGQTLTHLLANDGGMKVDGVLAESCEPNFRVFWRPDTPHPAGYTYGWLHADDQYLYAAVEITADNTPDEEDWGALFIQVDGALRDFRVSPASTTWGKVGFQYTDAVPYEHRVYEFQIALSELNASIGDELHYGFGAYGTVGATYAGIALFQDSDENVVYKNTVDDNDCGIYIAAARNNNISCNWVHDNKNRGFYLRSGSTNNTIESNNIMFNGVLNLTSGGYEFNFYNDQEDSVEAKYNYWAVAMDNDTIDASIYDNEEEEGIGEVTFYPFATGAVPCAPIPELPTVLLFSTGLLALAGYGWAKRKKYE